MHSEHPNVLGSWAITHELTRPHEIRRVDWEALVPPQQPFHRGLTQSAEQLRGYPLPSLNC